MADNAAETLNNMLAVSEENRALLRTDARVINVLVDVSCT